MPNTLRINDAILIADRAFLPFQCVAWTFQDGNGELSLTVLDRTQNTHLDRTSLPSNIYSDPQQLAKELMKSRTALINKGVVLAPWSMPE